MSEKMKNFQFLPFEEIDFTEFTTNIITRKNKIIQCMFQLNCSPETSNEIVSWTAHI